MKTTLISAQHPPIYLTSLSSWKPRSPTFHHRVWKARAETKGFGRAPTDVREGKNKRIDNVPGKTSGRNGGDDDDEIPEAVFERMIGRILFSVGVPIGTGLAFLKVFDAVKEQHLWDVPRWLPLVTTFLTFGTSALGIAYGALSTSLDLEKKGSFLGFEQAQRNWVEMWKEEEDSES